MTDREQDHRDDYAEARAEAMALGGEDFPSYEVWMGREDPREAAEIRVRMEMAFEDNEPRGW